VRGDELASCGYSILTESAEAGVDLFVKKKKNSLFVHFQGHPEYGPQTLLKEYRRDTKRFLRQERETYPTMPTGYFDDAAVQLLNGFREMAIADRREEIAAYFPETAVVDELQNTWHSSATCLYYSWLQYLESRRTGNPAFSAIDRVAGARAQPADGKTV
jgi:homoserine O-succinyltransferase